MESRKTDDPAQTHMFWFLISGYGVALLKGARKLGESARHNIRGSRRGRNPTSQSQLSGLMKIQRFHHFVEFSAGLRDISQSSELVGFTSQSGPRTALEREVAVIGGSVSL